MQQLGDLRRFMQQPLVSVLGILVAAAAAKTGHGDLAVGGIVTFVLIYVSAVVASLTSRKLALWVADAAA